MADRNIRDDAVHEATGRGWRGWWKVLDAWGAPKHGHAHIARFLAHEHGLSGWWSQMVAVEYERERGRQPGATTSHGADPPWRLLFLVGLTGVGKSTVVDALVTRASGLRLLPDRREIADAIILPAAQAYEGREIAPVRDRIERFRLTAAYRARHPGGTTHALAQWLAAHASEYADGRRLLFDNLRGLDEVRAAAETFPEAWFLVLDAPPDVRLARLIGRADPFDQLTAAAEPTAGPRAREIERRMRAIPGVEEVLDPHAAAQRAAREGLDVDAAIAAVRILVEEQRNYDSAAATAFLESAVPPSRLRVVDTHAAAPAAVVDTVLAWLARDSEDPGPRSAP